MSANDSAMTRFLFAILEQKCLKDIDWGKVANNPILPQPITNGHAARMRFSRFRQSLLGIEAKPRNRTKDKNRVTKSKKEGKGKKPRDDGDIKDDPDAQEAEETATKTESPRVKQEMSQLPDMSGYSSNYGNTSVPMHVPDMYSQLHSRLLTPCSDSDVLASSSSYSASPHGDMVHSDASFCHEHAGWAVNTTPYTAYGVPYRLDGYSGGYPDQSPHLPLNTQVEPHHHHHFCGGELGSHQHAQLTGEEMGVPEAMMDAGDSQVTVKHEDWASSPF